MEVLCQATKGQFKVFMCIGDSEIIKKDATFSFVLSGESIEEPPRDQLCLDAISVQVVETELNQQDIQPWTVYTKSCNCPLEICIAIPRWQSNGGEIIIATCFTQTLSLAIETFWTRLSSTGRALISVFDLACIGSSPFNYPVEFYAHHLLSTFESVEFFKPNFGTALIFVGDVSKKKVFEGKLRAYNFQVEKPKGFGQPIIPFEHTNLKGYINKLFQEQCLSKNSQSMEEEEPWKTFLFQVKWEFAKLLFDRCLSRVSDILSVDCFHESLSCNKSVSKFLIISDFTFVLQSLYKNFEDSHRLCLHQAIAENSLFIKSCMDFNCVALKCSEVTVWLGISVAHTALIAWSLPSRSDLLIQLEYTGAISNIIVSLQYVCVQDLSEENVLTQAIWLNFLILYYCSKSASVLSSYINNPEFYIVLVNLAQYAPDKEVTIICKALLARLSVMMKKTAKPSILQEAELNKIAVMLRSDLSVPFSVHGLPFDTLFSILNDLTIVSENQENFLKADLLSVIAELVDKLPFQEQEAAAKVINAVLQENHSAISIVAEDLDTNKSTSLYKSPMLINNSAGYFYDFLLTYVIEIFSSCDSHSLEEVSKMIVEVWPNIAVAVSLMRLVMSYSNEDDQSEIVKTVAVNFRIFKSFFLAFIVGPLNESSNEVIKCLISDVMWLLMVWSNQNAALSNECVRSSALFLPTAFLHCARENNQFDHKAVLFSLHVLLNCALNGEGSYPSFYFAEAISELIAYVKLLSDFKLVYLSKFTLSCFVQHLDFFEMLNLKLKMEEAKFCISDLAVSAKSPSLDGDTFTAYELLSILINFTNPCFNDGSALLNTLTIKKGSKRYSCCSQNILASISVFEENCSTLLEAGSLLESIEVLLQSAVDSIQEKCIHLVWNLLHYTSIKEKDISGIISLVQSHQKSVVSRVRITSACALYLFHAVKTDLEHQLKYAQSCYQYKNCYEAVNVCNELIASSSSADQLNQAKLLKGKALFYVYQPLICYLMKHQRELEKVEEKTLQDECFLIMKETIHTLGVALDHGYLDSEGSMLLDWAMMDCIRETNQLNLCKRCLMCRASKNLRRSHVWPRFTLQQMSDSKANILGTSKSSKNFMFGLDKHQFKSAGECWFWMLCGHCEESITQNAENDFSQHFPKDGSEQVINYGPWLFNYCSSIIFRTVAFVKFPRSFNDDEVYDTFVFCRNHLLSQKVKVDEHVSDLSKFIFQKYSSESVDFTPYLFVIPQTIAFQTTDSLVHTGNISCNWLAPHRLLDGWRDFSSLSHFFAACCNNICIIVKFSPSLKCKVHKSYEVAEKGGQYTIESEASRISAIPHGLWMLWNRMITIQNDNMTRMMRGLSADAAQKLLSSNVGSIANVLPSHDKVIELDRKSVSSTTLQVPQTLTSAQQLNLLPAGFMLTETVLYTTQKKLKFPKGHQVVVHGNFKELDMSLLCFIAVGSSEPYSSIKPYTIFILTTDLVEYCDGAFLSVSSKGSTQLSDFFLKHELANSIRSQLSTHYESVVDALSMMIAKHGLISLEFLIHYLKCRDDNRGAKNLPAIACKCTEGGCWYCHELCHYCMKPATMSFELDDNTTIQYCSKACYNLLYIPPNQHVKDTFVFNHYINKDDYIGMSIMDVLKITRSDDDDAKTNRFHYIHICIDHFSACKKPFIIWQIRSTKYQTFTSFFISQDLEILTPTSVVSNSGSEHATALVESVKKHNNFLKSLINVSLQSLRYKSFSDYLAFCYVLFNTKLESKNFSKGICNSKKARDFQSIDKKVVIQASVIALPSPRIAISKEFLTGITINQNQVVEFTVNLSRLRHLHVAVDVTSPFEDVFHIQLQSTQENAFLASLIPAFPGKYVLHVMLKLSVLRLI